MSSQVPSTLRALYLEILSWTGVKGWGHNRKVFEKWFASKKAFPSQRRRFQIGLLRDTCLFNISIPWSLHAPHSQHFLVISWQARGWDMEWDANCRCWGVEWPAWRSKRSLSHCCHGRLSCGNTYQVKPLKSIFVVLLYFPLEHSQLH